MLEKFDPIYEICIRFPTLAVISPTLNSAILLLTEHIDLATLAILCLLIF